MRFGKWAIILLISQTMWICPSYSQVQWIPGLGPATQPAWTGPMSPQVLPGNGVMQHPFLYAGEWNFPKPEQTLYIVRDGKITWSYSIPSKEGGEISEFSDATLLSDNSVVFSRKTGARKVTADKKPSGTMSRPRAMKSMRASLLAWIMCS